MRLIIFSLTLILLFDLRLTFAAEEKKQPSSMALAAWHYCNYDIEKLHHLKPISLSKPLLSQGSDKRDFWILCMRSRELDFSDKCNLSVQYQHAICWNSATKSKSLIEKLFSR